MQNLNRLREEISFRLSQGFWDKDGYFYIRFHKAKGLTYEKRFAEELETIISCIATGSKKDKKASAESSLIKLRPYWKEAKSYHDDLQQNQNEDKIWTTLITLYQELVKSAVLTFSETSGITYDIAANFPGLKPVEDTGTFKALCLPDELNTDRAKLYWEKAKTIGVVDKDYNFIGNTRDLSLFCGLMSTYLFNNCKWTIFKKMYGYKYFSKTYNEVSGDSTIQYTPIQEKIKEIF